VIAVELDWWIDFVRGDHSASIVLRKACTNNSSISDVRISYSCNDRKELAKIRRMTAKFIFELLLHDLVPISLKQIKRIDNSLPSISV